MSFTGADLDPHLLPSSPPPPSYTLPDNADGGDSEENGCYGVCNRDIDGEGVLLDWSWDYLARRARCKAEYFIRTQRFTKFSQSEVIFLMFWGSLL